MSIPHAPINEFHLLRKKDSTGISGTGVVARGVVMPSGVVYMEWLSHVHTETRFNSLRDVELLHGHESNTEIIMGSPKPEKVKKNRKKKKDE